MMAMNRFSSQSLTRTPLIELAWIQQRHRSGKAQQAQLIEVEVESSEGGLDSTGIRNLEDALQSIIARRAAPDWLPFLPGYSYYVPPPPPITHAAQLLRQLGQFSTPNAKPSLSRDESMSLSTNLGWPSSTYFIQGTAPTHPMPMGLVVEVNIFGNEGAAQEPSSEDE